MTEEELTKKGKLHYLTTTLHLLSSMCPWLVFSHLFDLLPPLCLINDIKMNLFCFSGFIILGFTLIDNRVKIVRKEVIQKVTLPEKTERTRRRRKRLLNSR